MTWRYLGPAECSNDGSFGGWSSTSHVALQREWSHEGEKFPAVAGDEETHRYFSRWEKHGRLLRFIQQIGGWCHLKKDTTPTRNTDVKVKHHQKTLILTKLSPWVILKIHWMPVATWKYQPALVGLVCQLVYGFVAVGCRLAPVTIVGCRVSWKLGRCVEDPQGFFSVSSIERSRSNEEDWGRNTETHTLLLPKMSP